MRLGHLKTYKWLKIIVYQTKYIHDLFQLSLKRRGSKDLPKSEKKAQQTPTEVGIKIQLVQQALLNVYNKLLP